MHAGVISERGARRIFEGEIVEASAGRRWVRGFHLEDAAVMRARGITIDEATRTAADSRGVYLAQIELDGVKRKQQYNGFFPVSWSRDEVSAAIVEAYLKREPFGWVDGGEWCKGKTSAGLTIVMELDADGAVLDAFPKRAKSRGLRSKDELFLVERGIKEKSRHVCGQCHSIKVLMCPNGHDAPRGRRLPRWFYRVWGRLRGLLRQVREHGRRDTESGA